MGAAIEIGDGAVRLSIARLAAEFGMARETVSKRLQQAHVQPDGKRNGYPVYRLRDACPALLDPAAFDEEGNPDPRSLPPDKRNAWYQSELRRTDLEMRCRQLIPAAEVEVEFATLVKEVVQFLDTLPDALERDAELSGEQVEALGESIARQRAAMHAKLTEGVDVRDGTRD
jgi:hypothetical protein